MKELYILTVVVKTVINRAIKIIELVPAPTHIMMSGPNDIFGNEFRTVR